MHLLQTYNLFYLLHYILQSPLSQTNLPLQYRKILNLQHSLQISGHLFPSDASTEKLLGPRVCIMIPYLFDHFILFFDSREPKSYPNVIYTRVLTCMNTFPTVSSYIVTILFPWRGWYLLINTIKWIFCHWISHPGNLIEDNGGGKHGLTIL